MRNDFQVRENFSKGTKPPRNKKNFRPTKSGAGMTRAGVKAYRRMNPGSKLKTAVTGKVKPGSKAQGVGGKPTNVPTFAKRKKAMGGGFMARRASYV